MKPVIVGLASLLLGACSSMQQDTNNQDQDLYKIIATAATSTDKDGSTCADATGVVRLLYNKIIGSAQDTFGRHYRVSGEIDDARKVTGGFAVTVITAVDFEGIINDKAQQASGTWEDIFECSGTWKATKIQNG